MSDELELIINQRTAGLVRMVWGLIAAGFLAGGWAASMQYEITALKARSGSAETSIRRIEFYVTRIAEKVGVAVEPPR